MACRRSLLCDCPQQKGRKGETERERGREDGAEGRGTREGEGPRGLGRRKGVAGAERRLVPATGEWGFGQQGNCWLSVAVSGGYDTGDAAALQTCHRPCHHRECAVSTGESADRLWPPQQAAPAALAPGAGGAREQGDSVCFRARVSALARGLCPDEAWLPHGERGPSEGGVQANPRSRLVNR